MHSQLKNNNVQTIFLPLLTDTNSSCITQDFNYNTNMQKCGEKQKKNDKEKEIHFGE